MSNRVSSLRSVDKTPVLIGANREESPFSPTVGWRGALLGAFGASLVSLTAATAADEASELWYLAPAKKWSEALPVGNGRLGAMVFGSYPEERLALNEETIWSRQVVKTDRVGASEAIAKARELWFDGQVIAAQKLVNEEVLGPRPLGAYQPLGDLVLRFADGEIDDYRRFLSLDDGIAGVRYRRNGQEFRQDVFASSTEGVLVIRLETEDPAGFDFDVELGREDGAKTVATESNTLLMTGQADEGKPTAGVRFEAGLRVLVDGGSAAASGNALKVSNARTATILVDAGTDFGGQDRRDEVIERLNRAAAIGYDDLRKAHVAGHRELFDRVHFALKGGGGEQLPTDVRLERVRSGESAPSLMALWFQYGRYLLISASRSGTLPANLQGIWNDRLNPPWFSGWHLDLNLQMNYWLAETTNLAECHEPLIEFIDSLRENGRRTAREVYGTGGFVVSHRTNAERFTSPVQGLNLWPVAAGWLAQHVWEHYAFTLDADYLSRTAYPILSETSAFFVDWLVPHPETGELVSGPSISPENSYFTAEGETATLDMGPTMDQQIAAEVFDHTLRAAKVLGIDDDFIATVKDRGGRLAPTRIGSDGRIREWSQEFPEREPNHRHFSHLYALYPGGQISRHRTPELAEAARRSLLARRVQPDGGYQNISNSSNTGWSLAWSAGLWARLGDGDEALAALEMLLRNATYDNLLDMHPTKDGEGVFQIDGNLGGAAAVAEMLLQSQHGVIDLLPALPSAWPEGEIRGLRARGGYTVDVAWVDGTLKTATLRAEHTSACRIRGGGELRPFRDGVPVAFETDGEDMVVSLDAGDVITLSPVD